MTTYKAINYFINDFFYDGVFDRGHVRELEKSYENLQDAINDILKLTGKHKPDGDGDLWVVRKWGDDGLYENVYFNMDGVEIQDPRNTL